MALKLQLQDSSKPKYRQLADCVRSLLRKGQLAEGAALPSINAVCSDCGVSRDTVVKAYAELKRMGLVDSAHGKEFYVVSAKPSSAPRALLLLDELTMYKQRLVEGFREALGPDAECCVLCHGNSLDTLRTLLNAYGGKYEYLAVIPSFEIPETLSLLKAGGYDGALLLDRFHPSGEGLFPAVYQDFELGVFEALEEGLERLRRYKRLRLLPHGSTHIAKEIERGFSSFAKRHGFQAEVRSKLEPKAGDAWLVVSDEDLVKLIKRARASGLSAGADYGLLSYNDTPLKEIVEGGVSVVSTDFREMGLRAGSLLISGGAESVRVRTRLLLRKTL